MPVFYEFIHIKLCCQSKEEKTMVNKKIWLGILVMVLVFGMTVVGCDEADELNGRWVNGTSILVFDSGDFESSPGGVRTSKGTYTVNNGLLTQQVTHIHGDSYKNTTGYSRLQSTWYRQEELKTAVRSSYTAWYWETYNRDVPESTLTSLDTSIASRFTQSTVSYTFVDKNTLIIGSQTWVKG
jgi:hypothetical protein